MYSLESNKDYRVINITVRCDNQLCNHICQLSRNLFAAVCTQMIAFELSKQKNIIQIIERHDIFQN